MTWYYKDGEQEIGPVDKGQLQALIHAKRINARTLVRNASMNDWRPLGEMVRGNASASPPQTPPPAAPELPAPEPPAAPFSAPLEPAIPALVTPPSAPEISPAVESAVCSQCGRSFPKSQVVQFDNQVICAACKPIFVQRLREGVSAPGILKYAGFWIRVGAKFIDGLIMAALQYAIIIPMTFLFFSSGSTMSDGEQMLSSGSLMLIGIQQLIGILIPAAYNTFFIGRYSATPGKMACKIKVVSPENAPISYARALGRYFAEVLSAIVLGIGYIMAAFDSEKRALHDRVCSTRVVYK
ncbi:MAG: RDD family protein [Desulfobacterales bacterium]|nr:RDD family protein [Desulfobacterales bacterium]